MKARRVSRALAQESQAPLSGAKTSVYYPTLKSSCRLYYFTFSRIPRRMWDVWEYRACCSAPWFCCLDTLIKDATFSLQVPIVFYFLVFSFLYSFPILGNFLWRLIEVICEFKILFSIFCLTFLVICIESFSKYMVFHKAFSRCMC